MLSLPSRIYVGESYVIKTNAVSVRYSQKSKSKKYIIAGNEFTLDGKVLSQGDITFFTYDAAGFINYYYSKVYPRTMGEDRSLALLRQAEERLLKQFKDKRIVTGEGSETEAQTARDTATALESIRKEIRLREREIAGIPSIVFSNLP